MVLIVGGEGSGKRSFAETLGYAPEQMADAALDAHPVVYHVEKMVFPDAEHAPELLEPLCGKDVVICCEVGSGVIPAAGARRWDGCACSWRSAPNAWCAWSAAFR